LWTLSRRVAESKPIAHGSIAPLSLSCTFVAIQCAPLFEREMEHETNAPRSSLLAPRSAHPRASRLAPRSSRLAPRSSLLVTGNKLHLKRVGGGAADTQALRSVALPYKMDPKPAAWNAPKKPCQNWSSEHAACSIPVTVITFFGRGRQNAGSELLGCSIPVTVITFLGRSRQNAGSELLGCSIPVTVITFLWSDVSIPTTVITFWWFYLQNRARERLGPPRGARVLQARSGSVQKRRVPRQKVDFGAPGSILELRPDPPKTRFGPPRHFWVRFGLPKWSHFRLKSSPGAKNEIFGNH